MAAVGMYREDPQALPSARIGQLAPDLQVLVLTARDSTEAKVQGLDLGVGAKLTRLWRGRPVEVVVEREGFRWEDQLYPSLSAAATAIAGTRWNGPRFFGLRGTGV